VKKLPVRVPSATTDRLITGWAGPDGTRVRLARPGDIEQVSELITLAGIRLDPEVGAVIQAGTVASTLLAAWTTASRTCGVDWPRRQLPTGPRRRCPG
jgi:hypothetical protein